MPARALFGVASRAELLIELLKSGTLSEEEKAQLFRNLLTEVAYGCMILRSQGLPTGHWQQVHQMALEAQPRQLLSRLAGALPRVESAVSNFAAQVPHLAQRELPAAHPLVPGTEVPMATLRDVVLFPSTVAPLWLGGRCAAGAQEAGPGGRLALFMRQRGEPLAPRVGVLAEVLQVVPYAESASVIALVRAEQRVYGEPIPGREYNLCRVQARPWQSSAPIETDLLLRTLREQIAQQVIGGSMPLPAGMLSLLARASLEEVLHLVGAYLPWHVQEQQALLESESALAGGQTLARRLAQGAPPSGGTNGNGNGANGSGTNGSGAGGNGAAHA